MTAKQKERLSDIEQELRDMCDQENEKMGNLPEAIQASARGDEFQENIDALEEAISGLQQITAR